MQLEIVPAFRGHDMAMHRFPQAPAMPAKRILGNRFQMRLPLEIELAEIFAKAHGKTSQNRKFDHEPPRSHPMATIGK